MPSNGWVEMDEALSLLAHRKRLLQARNALYRLRISRDLRALLVWPHSAAIASTQPLRPLLFGLALAFIPKTRLTAWVAIGAKALLLVRLAALAVQWVQHKSSKEQP